METAVISSAADLDFLAGMVAEQPSRYHGTLSHSIAAAVAAGMTAAILGSENRRRRMLDASLVYGSHLLLDALGKEQENGMPLLWPVSKRSVAVPGSAFRTIHRRQGDPFIPSLIHRGNRKAVTRELKILLPVLLAVRIVRRWV